MAQKNTKSTLLDLETYKLARKMADEYGLSILDVLEKATERLHKKVFFQALNNDFLKLTRVNEVWKQENKRREILGINLRNGENL
ncbi:MAG: hypothetical protein WEB89_10335 [Balneolales bacterium]